MTTKPFFLLSGLICLISISFNSFASNGSKPNTSVQATELMHKSKGLFFEENKGQLMDENRKAITDVKYYGHSNGVYLYCKPGMLSFVFTKVEKDEKISEATGTSEKASALSPAGGGRGWKNPETALKPPKITTSRMDLVLIGSNPSATITATDQQEYYENFYTTGDADHGITNVHTYKTVTYKNIYANIDMILKTAGQGLEYSFLVHPGGKLEDIQLRWDGNVLKKDLKNGGIQFENTLGCLKESSPKSFVAGSQIHCRNYTNQGICKFTVGAYNKSKDLLIDPSLVWSTYYGDSDITMVIGINTESSGNVYIAGQTESKYHIATTGAYQTSLGKKGSYDAFVAEFSPTGNLSWATYYGGGGQEQAYRVNIDSSGSIYIDGMTTSSNGIATTGAYQTSFGGGYSDGFLAKFSSTGSLSWATYIGGSDSDQIRGLGIDKSGNAYIAGLTTSSAGIASSGAYQTSFGGSYDVFVGKFNSSGKCSWITYYGGNGQDLPIGCDVDDSGNVYISGWTYSLNGIATSGANRTSFSSLSAYDGFLAKFSSTGSLKWGTYFGNAFTLVWSVSLDRHGYLYITGVGGEATSGAYQSTSNGYGGFLAKFNTAGAETWATYFGNDYVAGRYVSSDGSGNVYVAGDAENGIGVTTSGSYQTSFGGDQDGYLAKFTSSGKMTYATYFGGNDYDYGRAVCADRFGNVYLSGHTSSLKGISTTGAYQTKNSGAIETYLAKFRFNPYQNDAGIDSIKNPSGTACSGSQYVKVKLENYGTSTLTTDSIYWKVNGTAQTPIKWTGSLKTDSTAIVTLGTYNFSSSSNNIVAWSAKPNNLKDSIPNNDTAKINFTLNTPAAAVASNTGICLWNTISIGATAVTGSSYSWSSSVSGFSSTSSNPSVSPTSTTSYTLTETNAKGCSKSNAVTITVDSLPAAAVIANTTICSGATISIGASPVTGSIYSWASSVSGFWAVSSNPSVSPTSIASYTLTETNANGCVKSNTVTITVNSFPAAAVISDTAICTGNVISIGAAAVTGSSYSWSSWLPGFSSKSANPSVSPTSTTTYSVTETDSKDRKSVV